MYSLFHIQTIHSTIMISFIIFYIFANISDIVAQSCRPLKTFVDSVEIILFSKPPQVLKFAYAVKCQYVYSCIPVLRIYFITYLYLSEETATTIKIAHVRIIPRPGCTKSGYKLIYQRGSNSLNPLKYEIPSAKSRSKKISTTAKPIKRR